MAICEAAEKKGMRDHTLVFDNPHFLKGLNATVRSGQKWKNELNPGDTLLLVDRVGTFYNNARVLSTEIFDIRKFPAQVEYLLNWGHDPKCRTLEGLYETLNKIYEHWGPTVTVILFWIDDIDPNNHATHSEKHFAD